MSEEKDPAWLQTLESSICAGSVDKTGHSADLGLQSLGPINFSSFGLNCQGLSGQHFIFWPCRDFLYFAELSRSLE